MGKGLLVKVCGLTDTGNVADIIDAGADLFGFVFVEGSPRNVPLDAPMLRDHLPLINMRGVAVVRDLPIEKLLDLLEIHPFRYVQLHGRETPEYCMQLQSESDVGIVKTLHVAGTADVARASDYADCCDFVLYETPSALGGGSGTRFDWNNLKAAPLSPPALVSGGIGPEHSRELGTLRERCSSLLGCDINSRFEISPGIKDAALIKNFIAELPHE